MMQTYVNTAKVHQHGCASNCACRSLPGPPPSPPPTPPTHSAVEVERERINQLLSWFTVNNCGWYPSCRVLGNADRHCCLPLHASHSTHHHRCHHPRRCHHYHRPLTATAPTPRPLTLHPCPCPCLHHHPPSLATTTHRRFPPHILPTIANHRHHRRRRRRRHHHHHPPSTIALRHTPCHHTATIFFTSPLSRTRTPRHIYRPWRNARAQQPSWRSRWWVPNPA